MTTVQLSHVKRRITSGQLNMAAMIDVVFLLLIFFMCTSSFLGPEHTLATQLPRVGTSPGTMADDFEPARIHVAEAGKQVLVTIDRQPCATYADLVAELRQRRRVADIPVIIEGDPGVPFRYMVAALDSCHAADLHQVAFSFRGMAP